SVTQRLDRLERENRRLKGIGAVVLVGLAAVAGLAADVLMGQAGKVAKVVEAEKLALLDGSGRERAALLFINGVPGFTLSDKDGDVRMRLSLHEDGSPALGLIDKNGAQRASLSITANGERVTLGFGDTAGKQRVTLGLGPSGSLGLFMGDEAERA